MRYLKTIILFIVLFVLVSCSKKNQYTEVTSVTFTLNGITTTVYSSWYIISTGEYEVATEEKYKTAEFTISVMVPSGTTIDSIAFYISDLFSRNIYDSSSKPYKPYNISMEDVDIYKRMI